MFETKSLMISQVISRIQAQGEQQRSKEIPPKKVYIIYGTVQSQLVLIILLSFGGLA